MLTQAHVTPCHTRILHPPGTHPPRARVHRLSSQTWQDYWLDAISVCLARGRGRIGSEVARTDMFHRQAIHSVPGSEGVAP